MTTHKIKPIKVKEMRVSDIPPGTPFTIYGCKYIMINPINPYNEFIADVRRVIKNRYETAIVPANINNSETAHVSVDVTPRHKPEIN